MKLIVAGSRTFYVSHHFIDDVYCIKCPELDYPEEIVCGGAKGIDEAGKRWGHTLSSKDRVKLFPADWDKHGKAAGPIRNREMAQYADALLLIWDGKSRGSANMKSEMQKLGKPVYEVIL